MGSQFPTVEFHGLTVPVRGTGHPTPVRTPPRHPPECAEALIVPPATVDDRPMPIQRTNFAFRGVEVPAGQHRVVFEFTSRTLQAGLAISGLSVLIGALLLARNGWRARARQVEPEASPAPTEPSTASA